MPKVVIREGPGAGSAYELERAAILGRLDTSDIPVKDIKASREHAKIYRQGKQYAIVDLNSSNGTFVNGEKVTKRILKPGDEIAIGTVRLVFEAPEEETPEATAERGSLDTAYDAARRGETKRDDASGGAGGAGPRDIVLRGHQPLQYGRIRPGRPLLGVDLDQLSDTGRLVVYLLLVLVFAALMYLAYVLVVG